ncbi:hypothetical protein C882_3358 [Caenispirillum salinarum AK4]|uniref:Uncharacterized protein n=1 Tax=Caenispirillum salinarum AK4 TaxID=1238182 RepID=K9GMR4_9PROT|nr:hypothetical protein C882_3358 [Caenispirillum salinarum AK4]
MRVGIRARRGFFTKMRLGLSRGHFRRVRPVLRAPESRQGRVAFIAGLLRDFICRRGALLFFSERPLRSAPCFRFIGM